ncbi:putative protein li-ac-35 [Crotalus adamanteus]|uniref:Uncharacterized protein n=1 Tax=Crotalus adamanteus TaxID=8729 RepID=A0AAW1ANQ8_CROAD
MWNECYAQCPASTVTIQPPPFVLTIPGPALYCPDQPLGIEQHNPCAAYPLPLTRGGSNFNSFYSQALPSANFSSSTYRLSDECYKEFIPQTFFHLRIYFEDSDLSLNFKMSAGSNMRDHCTFSCPPSTVTVQPPSFILTIPGPTICCPDQSLCIEQHNPCAINNQRHAQQTNRVSSFYSRALPSTPYSPSIYWF